MIAEHRPASSTFKEYAWLGDTPIATVDATVSPSKLYYVHVDHLDCPSVMTDATKAVVWKASYEPFGAVRQITGPAALDLRFPGQWFQLEAGLAYNWNRHYDPTLGRYIQPDPLGFIDGASVYGYAGQRPGMNVDPRGLQSSGGLLCTFLGVGCEQPELVCKKRPEGDECDKQYEDDMDECSSLQRYMENRDPTNASRAASACRSSAATRLSECMKLGGKAGIRTPLATRF